MDIIRATDWICCNATTTTTNTTEMDQQDDNNKPSTPTPETDAMATAAVVVDPKGHAEEEEEEEEINWLRLIDEVEQQEQQQQEPKKEEEEEEHHNGEEKVAQNPEKCACGVVSGSRQQVSLVDHLCKRFNCSAHELNVLFKSLEQRRAIVGHLRTARLRTSHLRPSVRNFPVRCNELSVLDAHSAPAYRGYLGITVRMHYYIKHGIRLRHPNFPCVVEFGGGDHKTFFPLEVLSVVLA